MKNTSANISEQISQMQTTIATLEGKAREFYSASENAEAERSSHAFAALVEGDKDSEAQMERLAGRPQQLQTEAKNIESALAVAIKKLLNLRAQFASAVLMEKIQECRSMCDEARVSEKQLQKLSEPLIKAVAKASAAETKLRLALRELGEIVKPRKLRRDFDAPLGIENIASNLGSPVAVLASHVLGSCDALSGVEIGKCDERMLAWYSSKLDEIEHKLDNLQPQTKDAAA